jgi:hypothetical protein
LSPWIELAFFPFAVVLQVTPDHRDRASSS